jgi:hypothetical protein
VRALCPLAFPRAAEAPLGNDWCFVDVPMPCALPTMVQRLEALTYPEPEPEPEPEPDP